MWTNYSRFSCQREILLLADRPMILRNSASGCPSHFVLASPETNPVSPTPNDGGEFGEPSMKSDECFLVLLARFDELPLCLRQVKERGLVHLVIGPRGGDVLFCDG